MPDLATLGEQGWNLEIIMHSRNRGMLIVLNFIGSFRVKICTWPGSKLMNV